MIAPRCIICGKWSNEAGGDFVQFKVIDPKEIEHNEEIRKSSGNGKIMFTHPAGNYFFCGDHQKAALKHRHLTWIEAFPLIKEAAISTETEGSGILKIFRRFFSKS